MCTILHLGNGNSQHQYHSQNEIIGHLNAGPPSENPGPWAERSRALIYRAVTDPKYNWQCWLWALPGPTGPYRAPKSRRAPGHSPPLPPSRRACLNVVKDLRVIVNPNLKFVNHICGIVSRAQLDASQIISFLFCTTYHSWPEHLLPTYDQHSNMLSSFGHLHKSHELFYSMESKECMSKLNIWTNLTYAERIIILKLQSLEQWALTSHMGINWKL